MKDLVIFGTGIQAELADYYFCEDSARRVAGFTVDDDCRDGASFLGRRLVAFEDVATSFPPTKFDLFVAVGYTGLNQVRRAKVDAAKAKGYAIAHYISSRATTPRMFEAQENQFILEGVTVEPFAQIGSNVTLWSNCHVSHHTRIADDCFLAPRVAVAGCSSIGPRCFVGINATIRDHVTIGADCLIGAGAIVVRDIPDRSVLAPGGTAISKGPSDPRRSI